MKLFFEKYISNFIISGFKVKSILILLFTRIIFISIGLVIYNSIDYLLSGVYSNKLMIAEIAAIIISIIFFLPIQEYVEIYLKKKILL